MSVYHQWVDLDMRKRLGSSAKIQCIDIRSGTSVLPLGLPLLSRTFANYVPFFLTDMVLHSARVRFGFMPFYLVYLLLCGMQAGFIAGRITYLPDRAYGPAYTCYGYHAGSPVTTPRADLPPFVPYYRLLRAGNLVVYGFRFVTYCLCS